MFSKSFFLFSLFVVLLVAHVKSDGEEGEKKKKPNILRRIANKWDKFTDSEFFQPRPGFNDDGPIYLDVPGNVYADGSPVGDGVETVPLMWGDPRKYARLLSLYIRW